MADNNADDMRWTVRGVAPEVRRVAAEAADRAKVSVGAWLSRAVDREIAAERAPLDVLAPRMAADKSSDTPDGLTDASARLALIERAVAAAVALANAPDVPAGFRRRANRLLREGLPAAGARAEQGRLLIDGGQAGNANGNAANA
jgi:hypothetical protein